MIRQYQSFGIRSLEDTESLWKATLPKGWHLGFWGNVLFAGWKLGESLWSFSFVLVTNLSKFSLRFFHHWLNLTIDHLPWFVLPLPDLAGKILFAGMVHLHLGSRSWTAYDLHRLFQQQRPTQKAWEKVRPSWGPAVGDATQSTV